MKLYLKIGSVFLLLLLMGSCKSEYQKMVDREKAKTERADDLFLGLQLGMTRKDFFARCWELNKDGVLRQGTENTTVMQEMKDFSHLAYMNFYPEFHEDKIYKMPITFVYSGWAPWNKELGSDKLLVEVLDLLKQWHGEDFLEVKRPDGDGVFHVKQESNKRITVFAKDERFVNVLYTDTSVDVPQPTAKNQ